MKRHDRRARERLLGRRVRLVALLAALVLVAAGCAQPRSRRPPATDEEVVRRTVLSTEYDDTRVGDLAARDVTSEMGLVETPALDAYVSELGRRLVRQLQGKRFDYRFTLVDQFEPNALALPGGHIFISRGLLALVNTEDELANVLGHEIVHAAERHASARQAVAQRQNPLAMPVARMGQLAAYGRDQERDADAGGQRLAARAGYDPAALASFLDRLGNIERLRLGFSRMPSFFDTHPGTTERAAAAVARARELRWHPTPEPVGDHLTLVEGLLFGANPAEGVFDGSRFLHPDLGFQLRFPDGWKLVNTHQAVGASAPKGGGFVFLILDEGTDDPQGAAERFLVRHGREFRIGVRRSAPLRIGSLPAWRLDLVGNVGGAALVGQLTFVAFEGRIYRITAVSPRGAAPAFEGRARNVARSFSPLGPEGRAKIERETLRVVEAEPGEDLQGLTARTGSSLVPLRVAILNGFFEDVRFRGGERVKIARAEPYASPPAPDLTR
jgi:predicted Zn-dependent protease